MPKQPEVLAEGTKFDSEKARYDLLSPIFLHGTAIILEFGAKKYDDRNWEKGIKYSRVFGALQRHLWSWWNCEENDTETGYSHLWHAACCLMFLTQYMHQYDTYEGYDDRPDNYNEANPKLP
jgi:hypothetical protein